MASNHSDESTSRQGEDAAVPGFWSSIWENNKGALLILISEVCGSSMDAIARSLQQGGAGYHPFQVCASLLRDSCLIYTEILFT